MSREADKLREQADRAERLSHSVSNHTDCERLSEISKEYKMRAEQLDQPNSPERRR